MEQKVALLFEAIGPAASEAVMSRLDPDMRGRIQELLRGGAGLEVTEDERRKVLLEILAFLKGSSRFRVVGSDTSQEEETSEETEAAEEQALSPEDPIAALQQMEVPRLAAALEGEHSRTAAIVLKCIDGQKAGEVLARLPSEFRKEVFAQLPAVAAPEHITRRVAQAVVNKALALNADEFEKGDDEQYVKLADMLRAMDKDARDEILQALGEQDSETLAKVQELIYRFEDIERMADRSVQKLLAEIDMSSLATALHDAPEQLRNKIFKNLSRRAQETLEEELTLQSSINAAQVAEARKKIVEAMRVIDQAGDLVMES